MESLNYQSPIGTLRLVSDAGYLIRIEFTETGSMVYPSSPVLARVSQQLDEYFEGNRMQFDLPLKLEGTGFQRRVWEKLSEVPYGTTLTYLELAQKLEDKKMIRAAGRANGQNPVPIVIPCHRVIGSGGKLTGYAGGIERKRWLLQHEGALLL